MHLSAVEAVQAFFSIYCAERSQLAVVDLGASIAHGPLRSIVPDNCTYTGLGRCSGPGVNLVLDDPYRFPISDQSVDVVVASTCLERDPFYWLTFLEVSRVLKNGGLCYINAPSNGPYRPYRNDHWRFYPDAGKALEAWAARNDASLQLLESMLLPQCDGEPWNDFIAVYCKGDPVPALLKDGLHKHFKSATNVWRYGRNYPLRQDTCAEDRRCRAEAEYRWDRLMGSRNRADNERTGRGLQSLRWQGLRSGPRWTPGR
jgi:SAM-dependent methyltransferase